MMIAMQSVILAVAGGFLLRAVCCMSGDKVWKYYGFRLLGGRTFDASGNAANAMSALSDRTGTIYLLKVTHVRYRLQIRGWFEMIFLINIFDGVEQSIRSWWRLGPDHEMFIRILDS